MHHNVPASTHMLCHTKRGICQSLRGIPECTMKSVSLCVSNPDSQKTAGLLVTPKRGRYFLFCDYFGTNIVTLWWTDLWELLAKWKIHPLLSLGGCSFQNLLAGMWRSLSSHQSTKSSTLWCILYVYKLYTGLALDITSAAQTTSTYSPSHTDTQTHKHRCQMFQSVGCVLCHRANAPITDHSTALQGCVLWTTGFLPRGRWRDRENVLSVLISSDRLWRLWRAIRPERWAS